MEIKRPTCVITLYHEDTMTVSNHHVSVSAVADLIAKSGSFDVPLADFGYEINDEFARRLGGMILLTLAGRSPFLRDHLALSTEDGSTGEAPRWARGGPRCPANEIVERRRPAADEERADVDHGAPGRPAAISAATRTSRCTRSDINGSRTIRPISRCWASTCSRMPESQSII